MDLWRKIYLKHFSFKIVTNFPVSDDNCVRFFTVLMT